VISCIMDNGEWHYLIINHYRYIIGILYRILLYKLVDDFSVEVVDACFIIIIIYCTPLCRLDRASAHIQCYLSSSCFHYNYFESVFF
jgi:hypothetical protein